jgi:GTP cyclohydrolase II
MSVIDGDADAACFGTRSEISVTRGLAELHARRPVHITAPAESTLALPVDGLDGERLAAFRQLCRPAVVSLVVTEQRAQSLGIDAQSPVTLQLDPRLDAKALLALVCDATATYAGAVGKAGRAAQAAIQLAKMAQGLPAVLIANLAFQQAARGLDGIISVEARSIGSFSHDLLRSLTIASKASVPLSSGSRAEFVVFRDAIGGTSTAVIVGKPVLSKPVLVRLHSACLTGDVFGSRRCDCGEQLQLALKRLEDAGAGIVLYLPQEGRGVGLANKMRAYQMQDDGLDTVDANTSLGFEDDERDYGLAGRMLHLLGCRSVVLLTNNPAKLDGLARAGIEIAGRMAIETPTHDDNFRYMSAKAVRAGHRLDQLLSSLGKPIDTEDAPLAG